MHPVRSHAVRAEPGERSPVRPGDVVDQKYQVESVLGEGGMGLVVKAQHLQLHQPVALKFMLPSAAANQDHVARFRREARAAVCLRSEHVARVLDVGNLDSGLPYMVMEFLDGEDLAAVLDERGTLPVDEALELALQAAIGLAEAHAAGIVHRDIKPENLFLTRGPDGGHLLKILDFGISKATLESEATHIRTKTGAMLGSPHYMSPEQMRLARDVDERTDIWALGAMLYTMLSGRSPFYSRSLPELCANVLHEPPPPLRSLAREVPAEVEAAIHGCLEKDRDRRFRTIADFARAIAPAVGATGERGVARIEAILLSAEYQPPALALGPEPEHRKVATSPTLQATRAAAPHRRTAGVWMGSAALLLSFAAMVWAGRVLVRSSHDGSASQAAATRVRESRARASDPAGPLPPGRVAIQPRPEELAAPIDIDPSAARDPVVEPEPDPHPARNAPLPRATLPPPAPDRSAGRRVQPTTPTPDDHTARTRSEETAGPGGWVHPADRRH